MRNFLRVLIPVLFVLGFAAPIGAQEDFGCCTIYEQAPPPDPMLGANVFYCSAKGSWGGYCVDCVQSKTDPNKIWCASVNQSGKCNCDPNKCSSGAAGSTSGSCSYQP